MQSRKHLSSKADLCALEHRTHAPVHRTCTLFMLALKQRRQNRCNKMSPSTSTRKCTLSLANVTKRTNARAAELAHVHEEAPAQGNRQNAYLDRRPGRHTSHAQSACKQRADAPPPNFEPRARRPCQVMLDGLRFELLVFATCRLEEQPQDPMLLETVHAQALKCRAPSCVCAASTLL
eukprot:6212755-Pleurochrysis_carterae.AAC.2